MTEKKTWDSPGIVRLSETGTAEGKSSGALENHSIASTSFRPGGAS